MQPGCEESISFTRPSKFPLGDITESRVWICWFVADECRDPPTHPPGEYGLGHPSPPIIKPQHVHSSPPLPTYLLPTAPSRKNKMNIRPNRIPALSKKHNPHREQHSVNWWKSHSRSGVWSANWNAADSCSDCSSGGDGRCFRFWGKGKSGRNVRARGWRLGKLMTLLFDLVEVT